MRTTQTITRKGTFDALNKIEKLKLAMEIEEKNNFPNGDFWNQLDDELTLLTMLPNTFTQVSTILNSPKE